MFSRPHWTAKVATLIIGGCLSAFFGMPLAAASYNVLKTFASPDPNFGTNSTGAQPHGGVTLNNGVLYGTTEYGGNGGHGVVFRLDADGTSFAVLKHFSFDSGSSPIAGVIVDNGVLYGTTDSGGPSGYLSEGTIFKMNIDGSDYTILKAFTKSAEVRPDAGLILAGGTLYGATLFGGNIGDGAVFRINTNGTGYSVVASMNGLHGAYPYGGLAIAEGTVYGTTLQGGGVADYGVLYRVGTNGTGYGPVRIFTNIPDGASPYGALVVSGSTIYGTTLQGGTAGRGTIFKIETNGAGYAILKNFTTNNADGISPVGGLLLQGEWLYGTASAGGNANSGTLFRVRTNGTSYTVLKQFSAASTTLYGTNSDGCYPLGTLVLNCHTLYGATYYGGNFGYGVVFSLNLAPEISDPYFSQNSFGFNISGVSNDTVVIEVSTSLTPTGWSPLQTNSFGPSPFQFVDSASTNRPGRFYRARSLSL